MRRAKLFSTLLVAAALAACATPVGAGAGASLPPDPFYRPFGMSAYDPFWGPGWGVGYGARAWPGDVVYDRWGDPYVVDGFGRLRPFDRWAPPARVRAPDRVAPRPSAPPVDVRREAQRARDAHERALRQQRGASPRRAPR